MCVRVSERREREHRRRVRATAARTHLEEGEGTDEEGTSARSWGTPPHFPALSASGPRTRPASGYLSYVDESVLAGYAVGLREAAGDFDCPVVGVDARPAHGEQAAPKERQYAEQVQPSRAAAAAPPAHGPGAWLLLRSLACSAH